MDERYREMELASLDGYPLQLRIYDSKDRKAVIQCIHGMEEHQGRYEEFACFLASNGYVVVTSDLRGHGAKAKRVTENMIHIADRDGDRLLIEDETVIRDWISGEYPECPVFLFGHSMGSIISRKILQNDSKKYDAVILSGYPNPQGLSIVGVMLSAMIGSFKGRAGRSKLCTNLAVGPFCKAIPGAETPVDWLSVNKENVQRYIADPLCGQEFTIGSYNALFHLVWDIEHPNMYKEVKKELPILLICGEEDPCPGEEKGRQHSLERLKKAGFTNISSILMPHMRHEILMEDAKQEVYEKLLLFCENV